MHPESRYTPDTNINWSLPPTELIPLLRKQAEKEPVWNPKPVDLSIGNDFSNSLQETIFDELNQRLTHPAIGGKLRDVPNKNTPPEDRPNMITMFGSGELNSTLRSTRLYLTLPLPKPRFLLINTVPKFPNMDFDFSRWQLFSGACHNGVIFEGNHNDKKTHRALWVSMQGNHKFIEGTQDEIYDNVTRRILAHYGATFLEHRKDTPPTQGVSWQDWSSSSVHQEVSLAAQTLGNHRIGEENIIQNEVNLKQFGDSRQSEAILDALKKDSGLGESMRWQLVNINGHWIMAVTRSGGGKVEVSSNPDDGHLVPLLNLTKDGYEVLDFSNSPVSKYSNGSVESHESGRSALHSALAMSGEAGSFQEAEDWIASEFQNNGAIPIIPEGMQPMFTVGDHIHWFTLALNPQYIEVVKPDTRYFPYDQDFPCGSIEGARSLLSALWLSPAFQNPDPVEDPLQGKLLVAELGGHGMMAYGNNREQVTNALTSEEHILLKKPEWV